MSSRVKKFVFVSAFVLLSFLATVAVDRIVGLLTPKRAKPTTLIFPPHSEASYKTIDFNFTASINGLGFRDREFKLTKSTDYRIITIGDSFTYGWGISLEESWPKVLERNLQTNGLSVEIANLGEPGAGPFDYADLAETAIPLLKPDLVVVGVLQGDDLAQLKHEPIMKRLVGKDSLSFHTLALRVFRRIYPNLTKLEVSVAEKEFPARKESVKPEWEREAKRILSQLDPEGKNRYDSLEQRVRDAFVNGELNPDLVSSALKHPNYFRQTFDLSKPEVRVLVEEMAKQFGRIKRVADQNRAHVLIVSVPFGIYVNRPVFETRRRYGFYVDKDMLVSDSPDRAIRMASEKARLPFVDVTEDFRKNYDAHLFFDLDNHLDASGHRFYADRLTHHIEIEIKQLPANGAGHS